MMMAIAITPTKTAMSCGLSTRRRMIISGRLRPTTDIMKASTVPRLAPFSISAPTMGTTPAAFEYSGMPINTVPYNQTMVNVQRLYDPQEPVDVTAETNGTTEWQMRNQFHAWQKFMTMSM